MPCCTKDPRSSCSGKPPRCMCNTTRLNPNPHEDKTHEGHIALREEDVKKFFLDIMIFFHEGCVSPPKKGNCHQTP